MRLFSLVLFHLMPLFYFYTKDENWLYFGLGIFLPLTLVSSLYDFSYLLKEYEKSISKVLVTFASYANLIMVIYLFFQGEYKMIMYITGYFFVSALCMILVSIIHTRKRVQPKG